MHLAQSDVDLQHVGHVDSGLLLQKATIPFRNIKRVRVPIWTRSRSNALAVSFRRVLVRARLNQNANSHALWRLKRMPCLIFSIHVTKTFEQCISLKYLNWNVPANETRHFQMWLQNLRTGGRKKMKSLLGNDVYSDAKRDPITIFLTHCNVNDREINISQSIRNLHIPPGQPPVIWTFQFSCGQIVGLYVWVSNWLVHNGKKYPVTISSSSTTFLWNEIAGLLSVREPKSSKHKICYYFNECHVRCCHLMWKQQRPVQVDGLQGVVEVKHCCHGNHTFGLLQVRHNKPDERCTQSSSALGQRYH